MSHVPNNNAGDSQYKLDVAAALNATGVPIHLSMSVESELDDGDDAQEQGSEDVDDDSSEQHMEIVEEKPAKDALDRDADYSDTEGSDSADEKEYQDYLSNKKNQIKAEERTKDLEKTLAAQSTRNKLGELFSAIEGRKDTDDIMFAEGERPQKKKLYRQEPKFKIQEGSRAKRISLRKPTKQQEDDLKKLNALLADGMPIEDAIAKLGDGTHFVVAQYRGIAYAPSKFSEESRRAHRKLDEIAQPILSQAALDMGGKSIADYSKLCNDPSKSDELKACQDILMGHAIKIGQALKALESKEGEKEKKEVLNSNVITRKKNNFHPKSLGDISVHLYAQDYVGFHKALESAVDSKKPSQPTDPLFKGLKSSKNPKVSTGDVPIHANKYAFEIKAYKGGEDDLLEPAYDADGRPRKPYSGKRYISLHPLSDYGPEESVSQLLLLQIANRINISPMIYPEQETQFNGMVKRDRVVHQRKAKFPNLAKSYKAVFAEKYGMTKETFSAFSSAMLATNEGTDERIYVEALLSSFLSRYADMQAMEDAQDQAEKKNQTVVYRIGESEFGFEPLQLPKIERKAKAGGNGKGGKGDSGGKEKAKKAIKPGTKKGTQATVGLNSNAAANFQPPSNAKPTSAASSKTKGGFSSKTKSPFSKKSTKEEKNRPVSDQTKGRDKKQLKRSRDNGNTGADTGSEEKIRSTPKRKETHEGDERL